MKLGDNYSMASMEMATPQSRERSQSACFPRSALYTIYAIGVLTDAEDDTY